MPNGLAIQGVEGDVDRVSVQSDCQSSFLLTRRAWRFLRAKWTEVELSRDELVVLRCNSGSAVVRLHCKGGPFGGLVVNDPERWVKRLKEGDSIAVVLESGRCMFVQTEQHRVPAKPGMMAPA